MNNANSTTVAVLLNVDNWHGFNLLGLFGIDTSKDKRTTGFFDEDHFRWMHQWGFNFARLPMDYRFFAKADDWTQLLPDGFAKVDTAVEHGRKYGIHVQICLHRAPGFTITSWDLDTDKKLQSDKEPQDAFINIWCEFARRYKDISSQEVSFNLINEPNGFTEEQYIDLFGRTVDAIHEIDPNRFIMLDGNNVAATPVPYFFKVPMTGQAFRGYTPHAISHYGAWYIKEQPEVEPVWPMDKSMVDNRSWIYEQPETTLNKYIDIRKTDYPIMIGEFGCYNKIAHKTALAWMDHCLNLWHKHGLGWAIWNLDGPFGIMDSERTDIEYEDLEGHKLDRKMLELLQKYQKSCKIS